MKIYDTKISMFWIKRIVFASIMSVIVLTSTLAAAAIQAENSKALEESLEPIIWKYEFDERIAVLYDPSDPLILNTGFSVYEALKMVYTSIDLIPIRSVDDFETIYSSDYIIYNYVFNTNLQGLEVGDDILEWEKFAKILKSQKMTDHVLGMGNAHSLMRYIGSDNQTIHIDGREVLDAQLALFFCVWTVGEILTGYSSKFQDVSLDIQKLGLMYFAENINPLIERQFQPIDLMGEENLTAKQIRYEAMKTPARIEPKYDIRELPRELQPALYISGEGAINADDVPLGDIPLKSGLRGPVGGVVDLLLEVLIGDIGGGMFLKGDSVQNIKTALESIKAVLGFIGNGEFSGDSALKALLDIVMNIIPFDEKFKAFFDLFVAAFAALRGDETAILDIIKSALILIIPDSAAFIRDLILDFLDINEELVNQCKKHDNFIDALLATFRNKFLDGVLEKLIAEFGGLSGDDYDKTMGFASKLMRMVIEFMVHKDLKTFAEELMPQILMNSLQIISNENDVLVNKLISLVEVLFSGAQLIDTPLSEAFTNFIRYYQPTIWGNKIILDKLLHTILDRISQAAEDKETSVSAFKTDLKNKIGNAAPTLDNSDKDLFVSVSTMVAGALNENFNDRASLPTLNETLALALESSGMDGVYMIMNTFVGVIGYITEEAVVKSYLSSTKEEFDSEFKNDPEKMMEWAIDFIFDLFGVNEITGSHVKNAIEVFMGMVKLIHEGKGNSFQGVMESILEHIALSLIKEFTGLDFNILLDIEQFLFPGAFGLKTEDLPTPDELVDSILDQIETIIPTGTSWFIEGAGDITKSALKGFFELVLLGQEISGIFTVKDIFTDGVKWLIRQIMEWIGGLIEGFVNDIFGSLLNLGNLLPPSFLGLLPIDFASFTGFDIDFDLGIFPNFELDTDAFSDWIIDMLFGGFDPWDLLNPIAFFGKIFSFFSITPVFKAALEVSAFSSNENSLFSILMDALGLEVNFSGSGIFELNLLTIKNGVFSMENFFKVKQWGFSFSLTVSRTFTLLDFLTGGAGGGVLSKLGKYIGLDSISIRIYFGIFVEIVKRAASASEPEESHFSMKITLGASVHFGIDLWIAGISFDGSLDIILTLFQDFAKSTPFRMFLEIIIKLKLKLKFLFSDWSKTWTWRPLGPGGKDLSPSSKSEMEQKGAMGFDSDEDGLSDAYESGVAGLNPNAKDTDGDKLTDKFETQTSKTDPSLPDTDGDGLDDFIEYYNTKTNPKRPDTDWDGLTDYEEAIVIGTNPLDTDTDEDGIDDYYEVHHAWDVSGINQSVPYVVIGGVKYKDRTDPLNSDTDGDGLIDGEEGERGPYYGLPALTTNSTTLPDDTTIEEPMGDHPPVIFNGGYTHPLDNDTDDDSYQQLYNGDPLKDKVRLRVKIKGGTYIYTTDWWEVKGMPIIYMIEGEPVLNMTHTNPCNPDSDGDTGIAPYTRESYPYTEILNSDGYELSLDPPSDPLDADTDDDGLIDGIEGTLKEFSNHTHYNNPDTDGDSLGDMQEFLLRTDPRHPDSDRDMVLDGQEYFEFGTNPFNPDTDYDGLLDGEELFWYHTNPFSTDSDGDKVNDWMELMVYFTDPMDEDSDNDRLTDFEEIFIYDTSPYDPDSDTEDWNDLNNNNFYDGYWEFDPNGDTNGNGVWDGDYLRDGDELLGTYGHKTDPLNWDTDYDSITYLVVYPGGFIDYSLRMSDGDEVLKYGTLPVYGDSDLDGISDGWEVYVGSDLIPNHDPIPLNPMSIDTDGDGLRDGQEFLIENISSLIYPYIGFFYVEPLGTSPVSSDTDQDGISDFDEIRTHSTDPNNWDSDNDTLSDYDELIFHLTDPLSNDTDSDNLLDSLELTAVVTPAVGLGAGLSFKGHLSIQLNSPIPYEPIYPTFANDSDFDDDLLPDGAEVLEYIFVPQWNMNISYGSDPIVKDSVETGVLDGMLFDHDHDGLPDGLEYYGNLSDPTGLTPTTLTLGGGPFNPDSDHDGLLDGAEYYIYGTNASNYDTDGDNFTDGLEIAIGTDPTNVTSYAEVMAAIDTYRGDMLIISPLDEEYGNTTTTVTVANFTNFQNIDYRISSSSGVPTVSNKELSYSQLRGQWESEQLILPKGVYKLLVTGTRLDGTLIKREVTFAILASLPNYSLQLLTILTGVSSFVGSILLVILFKSLAPLALEKLSNRRSIK